MGLRPHLPGVRLAGMSIHGFPLVLFVILMGIGMTTTFILTASGRRSTRTRIKAVVDAVDWTGGIITALPSSWRERSARSCCRATPCCSSSVSPCGGCPVRRHVVGHTSCRRRHPHGQVGMVGTWTPTEDGTRKDEQDRVNPFKPFHHFFSAETGRSIIRRLM